jgi:hypothetical protein
VDAPLALGRFALNAVASQAALTDQGVSWLFELLHHD